MSFLFLYKGLLAQLLLIISIIINIIGLIQNIDCHEIGDNTFIDVDNDSIIIGPNYHKWIRPSSNDKKVDISVSMQIDRFAFYNDIQSVLEMQALFEFKWLDPRLKFQCNIANNFEGNHYHKEIWTPDIQVSRSEDIDVFSKSKLIFLRIYCNGRVLIRFKSNLNLICVMNYQKYPFDEQTCKIKLISNDLTSEHLQLTWNDFLIDDLFYMSGHLLINHSINQGFDVIKKENFSVLIVELNLKRQFIHYMLVLFLPSILIVATSWISFWIEITSPPSRVTLPVTTLLALVTVMKESKQDIPKVSYIKAIDLWFVGCIVSIFLCLIEYVIVCYVYREERNKLKTRKRIKRSLSAASFSSFDKLANNSDPSSSIFHSSFLIPGDYNNRLKTRRFSSNCLPITNGSLLLNQHYGNRYGKPLANESPNATVGVAGNGGISPSSMDMMMDINNTNNNNNQLIDTPQEVAESIDRKCRYLFPLVFILFNFIYWSYM